MGSTLSTAIFFVGSVVIAQLLGPADYGFFSLVISVPALLIGLVNFGMTSAITRFSTEFRTGGRTSNVKYVIKSGLLFRLTLGVIASVFCFVFSDVLATYLINTPEASSYIKIASILILFQVLFETLNAIFIGLDTMEKSAIMEMIRAVTKVLFSPLLVILGFSIFGALIGHISGYVVGVGISLTLLLFQLSKNHVDAKAESAILKSMLKYGFPLYMSSLIVLFSTEYQTIILAFFASKTAIGNFQVTALFSTAITLVVYPFTALFPAFSKFDPESKQLGQFFRRSVKYTALLLVPASMAITVMSNDIIVTIYGTKFMLASTFIMVQMLANLSAGFGSAVLPYLFSGVGRTDIVLKSSLIYLVFFLPAVPLLLSLYDVVGLILASVICYVLATLYELFMASKTFNLTVDMRSSVKIYLASIISACIVFLFVNISPFSSILDLILGCTLFIFIYLTILPPIGVLNATDLKIFRQLFRKIKSIWPIIKLLLYYETKILKYSQNIRNNQK